jgi:hypothetical protein
VYTHFFALAGSICQNQMAEFKTMWGNAATGATLQGSGTRSQTGRTHRLTASACAGWTFKELADSSFVLPEVGLPVWWRDSNGDKISLTNRSCPSNTHTSNGDQGSKTNNWSPDGQLPSQSNDHTGVPVGPGVFAGAGTQSLLSQQVILPTGSSNLRQTLGSRPATQRL